MYERGLENRSFSTVNVKEAASAPGRVGEGDETLTANVTDPEDRELCRDGWICRKCALPGECAVVNVNFVVGGVGGKQEIFLRLVGDGQCRVRSLARGVVNRNLSIE